MKCVRWCQQRLWSFSITAIDTITFQLTVPQKYASLDGVKQFSTPEVAKMAGINTVTLERWLASGKVESPRRLRVGGRVVRIWTASDVERVRKHKQQNYRKGRGRKPKPKR
jgi:predicted DNA-binding transcriptional regulator AlpA